MYRFQVYLRIINFEAPFLRVLAKSVLFVASWADQTPLLEGLT